MVYVDINLVTGEWKCFCGEFGLGRRVPTEDEPDAVEYGHDHPASVGGLNVVARVALSVEVD